MTFLAAVISVCVFWGVGVVEEKKLPPGDPEGSQNTACEEDRRRSLSPSRAEKDEKVRIQQDSGRTDEKERPPSP